MMGADLYQEVILDHAKQPRNHGCGHFACGCSATHRAEGFNPLCGDQVQVCLAVEGERLREVRFEGQGCAISTASASLMTEQVQGLTVDEAEALVERVQAMVVGREPDPVSLGKLAVLSGVSSFPARAKCASLPWHALRAALRDQDQTTSED